MSHLRWEVSGEDADWWAEVSVLGVGLEHSWAYSRCSLSALGIAWGIPFQPFLQASVSQLADGRTGCFTCSLSQG